MEEHGGTITSNGVNSTSGIVFQRSTNTSNASKDVNKMFQLLANIVEKMGEENIMQIMMDSAANYIATGILLKGKKFVLDIFHSALFRSGFSWHKQNS